MRGTPDQVALAEKLINDMDKAKPEVVVDVVVMQVSRDKMRDLGIVAAVHGVDQLQPNATTTTTTTTTGTTTRRRHGTPNQALTLNKFANLTPPISW